MTRCSPLQWKICPRRKGSANQILNMKVSSKPCKYGHFGSPISNVSLNFLCDLDLSPKISVSDLNWVKFMTPKIEQMVKIGALQALIHNISSDFRSGSDLLFQNRNIALERRQHWLDKKNQIKYRNLDSSRLLISNNHQILHPTPLSLKYPNFMFKTQTFLKSVSDQKSLGIFDVSDPSNLHFDALFHFFSFFLFFFRKATSYRFKSEIWFWGPNLNSGEVFEISNSRNNFNFDSYLSISRFRICKFKRLLSHPILMSVFMCYKLEFFREEKGFRFLMCREKIDVFRCLMLFMSCQPVVLCPYAVCFYVSSVGIFSSEGGDQASNTL